MHKQTSDLQGRRRTNKGKGVNSTGHRGRRSNRPVQKKKPVTSYVQEERSANQLPIQGEGNQLFIEGKVESLPNRGEKEISTFYRENG